MSKLRIVILVMGTTQAMITAALGMTDIFPIEWNAVLVIVNAGLIFAQTQMPSWKRAKARDARPNE